MGMAWIQTLDVAGAFLGFTALLAVLLMLGKSHASHPPSKPSAQRPS
jgi:hypothetical protein